MIALIFEVKTREGMESEYLRLANDVEAELEKIDGFISIDRYSSLKEEGKIVSISYWEDEGAIAEWTNSRKHSLADTMGRNELFAGSVVRVAKIL